MKLFDDMSDLLQAPFVGELDLVHLFLLVGVVLISIIVWGIILHYMKGAASVAAEAVT